MLQFFVSVIACLVICMIFWCLICRVDTYHEFKGLFAMGMVKMDKWRYLGKIHERQNQQDGTQF